jgi:hypothetical protein
MRLIAHRGDDTATRLVAKRAVAAGADATTLKTIETEDMPLSYLPANSVRVRVRMVGDVAASLGQEGRHYLQGENIV